MPLCDCHPLYPDVDLPRIEPAANYPEVDSGERPDVVEVTPDAVATARQRVAELRADVEGNRQHLSAEHDRSTLAAVRVREAAANLNAARDVDDHQQTVYDQAAEDVATSRRLLVAAEQHLTQLEDAAWVADRESAELEPASTPADPRVDEIADVLRVAAVTVALEAGPAQRYRTMACAVLARFDAEHEAALAEQAGLLSHAHDTDLETVERGHRAELDEVRNLLDQRDADLTAAFAELRATAERTGD